MTTNYQLRTTTSFAESFDPFGNRRIIRELLARFLQRRERVGVAPEDEEDLDAQLDEVLVEREVGHLLRREQGERAVDEFQRGVRLGVVERVGSEAVQHARRVAQERLGVDELAERLAQQDRKSTRLNSSHGSISSAAFC